MRCKDEVVKLREEFMKVADMQAEFQMLVHDCHVHTNADACKAYIHIKDDIREKSEVLDKAWQELAYCIVQSRYISEKLKRVEVQQ